MKKNDWFHISTKRLCLMGILVALQIVVSRLLNVQLTTNLRVNLGFLPNAAAGLLMGPFCGALTAAAGDILGAVLFPSGAYFPGFTITAILAGMNYGLWLHGRKITWWRAALCILPVTVLCNILLNTLWLYLLYGQGMLADFPLRVYKNLLQYPVNVLLLLGMSQLTARLPASLRQV